MQTTQQKLETQEDKRDIKIDNVISINEITVLEQKRKVNINYSDLAENIINVFFALILLTITLPILLFSGIMIKVSSKGPIFYSQVRIGINNKKFKIYKLRTMRIDAEKNGAKWATVNDPRITKVGKFLRKTRIDELPQLINIIKRDMNFIGPRPEREVFANEFIKINNDFSLRTKVRPGLTGLAQIEGGYDLNFEEKLHYDLKYIESKNIKMDFHIVIRTIRVILTGEGAR
ncbi:sugar transferase [Exiguobacterium sp. R-17]|uniref:sugar transferase n=1 Tax=Exiguobacterium sp. R-17 TaxID=3404054 RepID=UPI003CEE9733